MKTIFKFDKGNKGTTLTYDAEATNAPYFVNLYEQLTHHSRDVTVNDLTFSFKTYTEAIAAYNHTVAAIKG